MGVSGIKQHKIAALIALVVIAASMVGVSAYLRARNTEVGIGSIAVLPDARLGHSNHADRGSKTGTTESLSLQFSIKPSLRFVPFPDNRDSRDLQCFGNLLIAQPAKEPQFNNPAFAFIYLGQAC